MAFSGGVFTRLYNWVTDRNNGIKILASRMDAEFDGMATGLSTCLLKDGTQIVTANIPMASHKFTGLAAGTTAGDSVRYEQVPVVPVIAASGGTGQTSYAVGDVLYASGSSALSKLADVAAGSYLRSGGVTTAPLWSTTTLPNSATIGDVLYASATNVYSNLAAVATGRLLASAGTGTAPAYTTTPTLGASGTLGSLAFGNTTSGTVTIQPVTGALGSVTLSLPAATDTLVGKATTDTFTNKTYDTAGSGNSFLINGVAASANTGTGAVARAVAPAFTTPNIGAATATSLTFGGTVMSNFVEGTYTPTLSNTTNVTSSTAFLCRYMRIGNTVIVWGKVTIQFTAATNTVLGMSLPIASNFAADTDANGTAYSRASNANGMGIEADATNDRVSFMAVNTAVTNTLDFSFSYFVI